MCLLNLYWNELMKYLIRMLTAYPRLLVIGVFALTSVLCMAVPAYALPLTPNVSAAANGPITCSGGPTLSELTTNAHYGTGEKCLVTKYINPIVTVLAGLVAVFVVLSIVIAGIQYSAAGDDSSKVAGAKGRIQKAIIALLAYLFMLAFVKYLLPGGI
jgi:hypothetical protein